MIAQPTDLRAGFVERVGIAFAMALGVGAVLATLSNFIGYANAFALASSGAATLYAVWLVLRSTERRALILAALGWTVSVAGLLVSGTGRVSACTAISSGTQCGSNHQCVINVRPV